MWIMARRLLVLFKISTQDVAPMTSVRWSRLLLMTMTSYRSENFLTFEPLPFPRALQPRHWSSHRELGFQLKC